jgi:hypothetical protein
LYYLTTKPFKMGFIKFGKQSTVPTTIPSVEQKSAPETSPVVDTTITEPELSVPESEEAQPEQPTVIDQLVEEAIEELGTAVAEPAPVPAPTTEPVVYCTEAEYRAAHPNASGKQWKKYKNQNQSAIARTLKNRSQKTSPEAKTMPVTPTIPTTPEIPAEVGEPVAAPVEVPVEQPQPQQQPKAQKPAVTTNSLSDLKKIAEVPATKNTADVGEEGKGIVVKMDATGGMIMTAKKKLIHFSSETLSKKAHAALITKSGFSVGAEVEFELSYNEKEAVNITVKSVSTDFAALMNAVAQYPLVVLKPHQAALKMEGFKAEGDVEKTIENFEAALPGKMQLMGQVLVGKELWFVFTDLNEVEG